MAFDGIIVANIVKECNEKITGGRITKIAQPEKDELLLTIKNSKTDDNGKTTRSQYRFVLSANPNLPLVYLTEENKPSPMQAPTFCMVLRKHLNNCKITKIQQIGLERVICLSLEHLNEMGDLCTKLLYIELMGKHSNIIFCDENNQIIDSIKHISSLVSSVREVLPGRDYFIPNTLDKFDPYEIQKNEFMDVVLNKPMPPAKALYTSLTGFSPVISNELLYRAGLSDKTTTAELNKMEREHLYRHFQMLMEDVSSQNFHPQIIYQGEMPKEFSALPLTMYGQSDSFDTREFEDISQMLRSYYQTKEIVSRIREKSATLRQTTNTNLERCRKKHDLQSRQLTDTQKRDKYKEYGDLLTTYGYSLKGGEKTLTCENYYTGQEITIPLDETKTAMENAKAYFNRYAKLKRTYEALSVQIKETRSEMEHLESISNALDIAKSESDLSAIRQELADYGYLKRNTNSKKQGKNPEKTKPLHYISSDGFHIYVGKNNYQNEELTFRFATGNDWWFHAKQNAGSHVIVKTEGKLDPNADGFDLPDSTFEEAARLAAYYSKAREQKKAEIDYIQRKHIKKPNGSKPGFVVYYTNYSMTISTDITGITEVKE